MEKEYLRVATGAEVGEYTVESFEASASGARGGGPTEAEAL